MKALFTYCLLFLSQFEAQEILSLRTAEAVMERARSAQGIKQEKLIDTLVKSIVQSPPKISKHIRKMGLEKAPRGYFSAIEKELRIQEEFGDPEAVYRLVLAFGPIEVSDIETARLLVERARTAQPPQRDQLNRVLAATLANERLDVAQLIHRMTFERAPIGYRFALEKEMRHRAEEGDFRGLYRLMQAYESQTGLRTQIALRRQLGSLVQSKYMSLLKDPSESLVARTENQHSFMRSLLVLRHDGLGSAQCEKILSKNFHLFRDVERQLYLERTVGGTPHHFVHLREIGYP